MYENSTDTLIMDNGNLLILKVIGQWDDAVEFSFRHDDETGWGCGSYEFVYVSDIKNMAKGIKRVLFGKRNEFSYVCKDALHSDCGTCLDDLLKIDLKFDDSSYRYSIEVSFLETLERDHHVTVKFDNLSKRELGQFVQPFIEWDLMCSEPTESSNTDESTQDISA